MVTWLTRIIPLVLLKKFVLPKPVIEFLSFVPIVIMSALWFSSLFNQRLGELPTINYENLFASLPTVLSAYLTKNLLVIVATGMVTLALIRLIM